MLSVVDVDNIISPFEQPCYEECLKINPSFPDPGKWDRWSIFTHLGIDLDTMHKIFDAVHARQEEFEPISGAQELMEYLYDNGQVIIATHRPKEFEPQLTRWLDKNNLLYDQVFVSWDKSVLFDYADLVIDDNPNILKTCEEMKIRACSLKWPWNVNQGFRLYDSLPEMLEALKNL
jgi:hypothetical protein